MIFLPLWIRVALNVILGVIFIPVLIFKIKRCVDFSSAQGILKFIGECIRDVLLSTGDITTKNAVVSAQTDPSGNALCFLSNAASHDERVFSEAISELLSPIDNPRYLIIYSNNSRISYACPTRIGVKKRNRSTACNSVEQQVGRF